MTSTPLSRVRVSDHLVWVSSGRSEPDFDFSGSPDDQDDFRLAFLTQSRDGFLINTMVSEGWIAVALSHDHPQPEEWPERLSFSLNLREPLVLNTEEPSPLESFFTPQRGGIYDVTIYGRNRDPEKYDLCDDSTRLDEVEQYLIVIDPLPHES